MKKLAIILTLTLIGVECLAFSPFFRGGMKPDAPDACSACPSDADNGLAVCEDFEGAGYLCSSPAWSEVATGTGAAVNEDTTFNGSQVIQITYRSDAGDSYATSTLLATMSTFYYAFCLRVVDTGLSGAGFMDIFVADNSDETTANHYIRANWVSNSTYTLQLRYRNTSDALSGTAVSTTLTEGQRYTVQVEGITNSNTIKMWVNGALVSNETDASNIRDPQYFRIGSDPDLTNNTVSGVFQVDNLKIDDNVLPLGVCQ